MNQKEFSEAVGMEGSQFLSNIERGLCPMPIKYWKRLSKFCEIPMAEIIEAHIKDERRKIEIVLKKV